MKDLLCKTMYFSYTHQVKLIKFTCIYLYKGRIKNLQFLTRIPVYFWSLVIIQIN